jgi:hypothetical protein
MIRAPRAMLSRISQTTRVLPVRTTKSTETVFLFRMISRTA